MGRRPGGESPNVDAVVNHRAVPNSLPTFPMLTYRGDDVT